MDTKSDNIPNSFCLGKTFIQLASTNLPRIYYLDNGIVVKKVDYFELNQYAIEDRLRNISIKLKNVGAYYEAAKNNINNPTKEHTALAINQLAGALSVFEIDIPEAAEASKINETEKIIIVERCKNAVVAINGFINFLKALKNENPRPFNIGKDLYFKKFELDIQSKFTAQEIYDRALQRKKELHLKMYEAALALWPKYLGKEKLPNDSLQLIRMMIDKLSINHTHRDSFQSEIDQQIPKLIEFIKQKNLIYIDPSKPLVVRKEPAYMQGVAGASISAKVLSHERGDKVIVFKKKRRKGYQKSNGHRQQFTKIQRRCFLLPAIIVRQYQRQA
jgi:ribosomal protein L21